MTVLKVLTDFLQLLADALEGLQHTRLVDDILLLTLEPLGSTFKSETFYLHKEMELLEDLNVLLGKEPVALCVTLWLNELGKFIRPETHQGRTFAYDFSDFTYRVEKLLHNFYSFNRISPRTDYIAGFNRISLMTDL